MVSFTSIILIVLVISIFYCLYNATPTKIKEGFNGTLNHNLIKLNEKEHNKEHKLLNNRCHAETNIKNNNRNKTLKDREEIIEEDFVEEDIHEEEENLDEEILDKDIIKEEIVEEEKYLPAKIKGDDLQFDANKKILDDYGFKDIPRTTWKANHHIKKPIPGCIEDIRTCKNGRCPIFLQNTFASPDTDFSVGTLMPTFVFYETGRTKKCLQ